MLLLALAATPAIPQPGAAQEGLRLGLALGGTGLIGVVAEWRWDDHGAELLLTTFQFRDLSVSVAGKQYFGASWLKPVVGGGLWFIAGSSPEGAGQALVARFPLGGDWRLAGGHYLTVELNVSRGLWVNQPDPADDAPVNPSFITLPGLSYRLDTG